MILSMSGQAVLFLYSVGMGAAIGLFYDAFRIFRKTAPHFGLAVQVEDLFFWLAATGTMFYFLLNQNFGEIRLFALLGAGCGVALYFATISRWVIKIAVAVVNYLKRVVVAAVRVILFPLRLVWGWISPLIINFARGRRKDLRGLARYGRIQMKKTTRNWFILRKKV